MLRLVSATFCVFYPLLIVSVNSPLLSDAFISANQAFRHILVWSMAVCAVVERRATLSNRRIAACVKISALASVIAVLLWVGKTGLGAQKSIASLYNAFEPVVVILCASGLSLTMVRRSHAALFVRSLVVWLLVFAAIHVMSGFDLNTSVYGRLRWTFGFVHPGKVAQLVMLVVLFHVFSEGRDKSLRSSAYLFFVMISAGLAVFMTSTRAMFVVYFITLVYLISEGVRSDQKAPLAWAWGAGLVGVAAYLFVGIDEASRHFLLSGRIAWLLQSVDLNFGGRGLAPFFLGVFDDPVGNLSNVSSYSGSDIISFRVDSGYLEVVTSSGFLVLALLSVVLLIMVQASTKRDLRSAALVAILGFFLAGESGFFAVGNSFGLMVVTLAMVAMRSPRHRF
ncbi:hypothetical protein [Oceanomicrobium pacificus]|uniref:Uncharacterized protein n=1 Tax=Oceanomicrobium pacificus TaxID=2692916 RepID=A0A6B0TQQ6_9RHOB|nr:hypothetical protein [Oceanomicrobium pacificus]MXU65019.1 hypothetical protein [Oceanomicrobium pacificus]